MQQRLQLIKKRFNEINKISKKVIRAGFLCLIALTGAAAILAVIDMATPGANNSTPFIIQSLFTYGFYLWAEITIGALILDYVFK